MKRIASLFSLLGVALGAPACGSFMPLAAAPKAPASAARAPQKAAETSAPSAPHASRKVGDFAVHRFSGSYEKAPLMLTEEVIGEEAGWLVIDYTFEEPAGTSKFRVRFDPRSDSVRSAARLEGDREVNVPIETYEQMITRTSFAADSNEGLLASTHDTCLVGPSELDCETKTYRVRVAGEEATLNVSHSDAILGGADVLGDITAKDGSLIYRSELLEAGTDSPEKRGVATR